ncbi:MAG: glycogen synthase, partial [Myxococcales bacterium]|nr:glycogen synthase [Myxococcales bacterium]
FDIIHAHDWTAALTGLFRKTTKDSDGVLSSIGLVFTIHNLAHQGVVDEDTAVEIGVPKSHHKDDELGFHGNISLMKSGIKHADLITTVSPTYAQEIQTAEFGCGLEGLLAERSDSLHGILNGVDYSIWNPEHDAQLPFHYDAQNQNGKRRCKAALQAEFSLPVRPRVPLIGVVSRLAEQKGIDLLIEALEKLLPEREVQAVILGDGDKKLKKQIEALAKAHPDKIGVRTGYDRQLAHHIFGGADIFAMPSRFEPCGLSQLYAMRYGTIPVVRDTGGLHDTVQDWDPDAQAGTGFRFGDANADDLLEGLERALERYGKAREWRVLISTAMETDYSWKKAAREYESIYRKALENKA